MNSKEQSNLQKNKKMTLEVIAKETQYLLCEKAKPRKSKTNLSYL
jgi:hypothetical protein